MKQERRRVISLVAMLLAVVVMLGSMPGMAEAKSKIRLNSKNITLQTGKTRQLSLVGISKKAGKKAVWKSSNKSVVSVSRNGRVKAKKTGTAVVTAKYKGKTYRCKIKVSKKAKRVAADGAKVQTTDPTRPTRVLKNGTRINMYFGDTVIPGILNDSKTAQAFIEMLPLTINESRYSHDFCGSMDDFLPFDKKDERYGWLNGDIAVGTDVPWFTILFDDEEVSEQYGNLVNIGVIDCKLSDISKLHGSYDVRIELAK